jgi:hypothetical protein
MNTTWSKPDSVSIGEHHAAAPRSERTMRCTPADSATSACAKPLWHAVADRAVVVERGEHLAHLVQHVVDADHVEEGFLLAGERCVGQVFGVADERTAKLACACRRQAFECGADRPAPGRPGRAGLDQPRISAPAAASARTSFGVERGQALLDALVEAVVLRNSRKACAWWRSRWAPARRAAAARSFRRGWRSCRRPPRRRTFSGSQTERPGRSR